MRTRSTSCSVADVSHVCALELLTKGQPAGPLPTGALGEGAWAGGRRDLTRTQRSCQGLALGLASLCVGEAQAKLQLVFLFLVS